MNASANDPLSIPCLYCDQRFEDVVAAQNHMAKHPSLPTRSPKASNSDGEHKLPVDQCAQIRCYLQAMIRRLMA
jgi:hypothetical protein